MLPGHVLGGKYRFETLLGQGGMGSVWRAEHLGLKAPVAVKLMDPALAQNAEGLARFQREAQAAALIRSPHVVQVFDHGLDAETNTPFIVMELLDGETLGDRLRRERRLSLAATASIVADVCRALTRAHAAGIVHRDLKPENVFIVKDEREFAKVLDFGVAKARAFAIESGSNTRTGAMLGTPYYMSPEQIRGAKDTDFRSDLWALAVIACECITGRRPFEEETIGGLAIAICTQPLPSLASLGPAPPAFEAWLQRGLERDPSKRFGSARELAESLQALCDAPAPVEVIDPPRVTGRNSPAALEPTTAAPLSATFGVQSAHGIPRRISAPKLGAIGAGIVLASAAAIWLTREGTPSAGAETAPPLADENKSSTTAGAKVTVASEPGSPTAAPAPSEEPASPAPGVPAAHQAPPAAPAPNHTPKIGIAPAATQPELAEPPAAPSPTRTGQPSRSVSPAVPKPAASAPAHASPKEPSLLDVLSDRGNKLEEGQRLDKGRKPQGEKKGEER